MAERKDRRRLILLTGLVIILVLTLIIVLSVTLTRSQETPVEFEIVSREDWGARPAAKHDNMTTPVQYVILHHTAWDRCYTKDDCSAEMRRVQHFHMDDYGWWDGGFSFCVGDDGRAYEGRGWDTVGAHAPWYNSRSLGICIFGNFMKNLPTEGAIVAVETLISRGIENNILMHNYTIYAHRQVRTDTTCPGDRLFEFMQNWRGWKPGQHYPPT
ncbi:peptidoglycan-recognition protein SC2-like [Glandiceps talaboti]